MTETSDRVLIVDDEQALLDGIVRQHRKQYSLVAACGPEAGLQAVTDNGPFAVVVTDFKMPGMNGVQFLGKAREHDSSMIPIMLTGQADMQVTIDAINRGHIFRFLTKPCEPEVFRGCIDAALEQWRLRRAERDLLEQTVRGSVEVLADVLGLSNPAAFGRATRIRNLVRTMVDELSLEQGWQYETAALLSQVGCVAVPDDLLRKVAAGEELSANEHEMYERHPLVAGDILAKIPRLQTVAEIVRRQSNPSLVSDDADVRLGARMLAAALTFDDHISNGVDKEEALAALRDRKDIHDDAILRALARPEASASDSVCLVKVRRLREGMVLREEIRNTEGTLLVGAGHEVTEGLFRRLCNYDELGLLPKKEYEVDVPGMLQEDETVAPIVIG